MQSTEATICWETPQANGSICFELKQSNPSDLLFFLVWVLGFGLRPDQMELRSSMLVHLVQTKNTTLRKHHLLLMISIEQLSRSH